MKSLSFSTLLLLTLLISSSCKKIPVIDKEKTGNSVNGIISFKVEGISKEAKGDKNVFAFYSKEESAIQIVGILNAAGETISLTIANFRGVGEYTPEETFLGVYSSPEMQQSTVGTEGKIKITEFIEGKSVKGEFHFKGVIFVITPDPNDIYGGEQVISDGKFATKITADLVPAFAAQ